MSAALAYVEVNGFSGHALVLKGHGLDVAAIAAQEGIESPVAVEVFWHETRRVKWCERIDGFGCDENGEWHRHWSEVKPTSDTSCHFTVLHEGDRP